MKWADTGLGVWWSGVPEQARRLALIGGVGLVAVLLVLFTVVPSIKVLRHAAADQQRLDTQLDTMRALAAQAQAVKGQPPPNPDEARRFIETSVKQRLAASGQVSIAGDRATVTVNNATPEAVAAWLGDARTNGRLLPAEAKLTRSDQGWSGQFVINLPAAR